MIIPAALECRDLSAGYDKLVVVRKLDLVVRHKEILAVLGPNGAGKTTLLMTLAGFLAPAGGAIMMTPPSAGPWPPSPEGALDETEITWVCTFVPPPPPPPLGEKKTAPPLGELVVVVPVE